MSLPRRNETEKETGLVQFSMKLIVLGDVHGNILRCQDVALRNPNTYVLQLGDLGVGFVPREVIEKLPTNFLFFPGNHDNRKISVTLPSCLGHFGECFITYHDGKATANAFYVSGADSKDKDMRIEGINWWPDEELTYEQGQECIDKWKSSDAQVIISHDLPQRIAEKFYLIYDKSRTRQILDSMITVRKPKLVVYGHHHKPVRVTHEGVDYIGLKIDETITLDISENNVKVTT
jgi:predicted phosphodiesterase